MRPPLLASHRGACGSPSGTPQSPRLQWVWKERINGLLLRRTGYQLQRVSSEETPPEANRQVRTLRESAQSAGWEVSKELGGFLRELGNHLDTCRPPKIAVLSESGLEDWHSVIKSSYPGARITIITLDALDGTSLHAKLAAESRYDAVVGNELTREVATTALQTAFFHLRPKGKLFIRLTSGGGDGRHASPGPHINPWEIVDRSVSGPAEVKPRNREEKDRRILATSVSELVVRRSHLTLTQRRSAVAKVREDEMDTVLGVRGPGAGSVLTRLPPQEFESRCILRENAESRDPGMPKGFSVPPMRLREYRNVLCLPRQVAVQRNVVLPDSFRFNAAPRLTNHFLGDLGPQFGQLHRREKAEAVEGTYYYLDCEWTPHFGHVLTEQMSRLWGVAEARQEWPDLKAVLSRRAGQAPTLAEYERGVFEAAGFKEADIVLHDRPLRLERLVAATPMMSGADALARAELDRHVHPGLADVWRDVGNRILAAASGVHHPRRIFCSRRRQDRRMCENIREVEEFFDSNGFAVVFPEDLPFAEQVSMFRQAEVIAGFSGSALFNAVFCDKPVRMIVIGPTTYMARNEYMICAVLGGELDYVWSQPNALEAKGPKPQYAGFRFDFDREGHFLREVLASL